MGGVFALFRNNPVPAEDKELYEELQTVYEKYYYNYYVTKERPVKRSGDDLFDPSVMRRRFGFDCLERFGFSELTKKLYNASRTYTADEYIELLDTFSDHRSLLVELREDLYKGVKQVILKHGGYHKVDYVFQLYMGRKPL